MADTLYYHHGEIVPGKAVRIWSRDSAGLYSGEYDGYYNFAQGTVTLYPAKKRFKYFGNCNKHTISISLLRRAI